MRVCMVWKGERAVVGRWIMLSWSLGLSMTWWDSTTGHFTLIHSSLFPFLHDVSDSLPRESSWAANKMRHGFFFLSVSGQYLWHRDIFLSCNASINFLWVLLRGGRGIHERISWNHVWVGDAKWDTVVIMACILWAMWKQIPWWQCQAALPQCGKPVVNREGDLQGASNSVLVHFQNELIQAFSFSKMFYLVKKFMVAIKNVKKKLWRRKLRWFCIVTPSDMKILILANVFSQKFLQLHYHCWNMDAHFTASKPALIIKIEKSASFIDENWWAKYCFK